MGVSLGKGLGVSLGKVGSFSRVLLPHVIGLVRYRRGRKGKHECWKQSLVMSWSCGCNLGHDSSKVFGCGKKLQELTARSIPACVSSSASDGFPDRASRSERAPAKNKAVAGAGGSIRGGTVG